MDPKKKISCSPLVQVFQNWIIATFSFLKGMDFCRFIRELMNKAEIQELEKF